ncbi:hypothetical protein TVAG_074950 [Trichomonas vaginalis G3]|uniref:Uncharacterized protein n=1 Tax=Trichomonas vaginalis (strain ATCC PRA-98 / G3) TaxID=412133 RepID=A2E412_TRIV3|nr:hypothetical protein TVAGG3_0147480 [Trichomonas vaginalis G3]EAY12667.1 hypothetical protein TVAG_074950 [Trichomonas vaginalis G3]KAI5547029.1 hypothetical protein TVAGG3_0147480 [Trichomonas vaginalis G3]|eukprot:XP_001324890.1 hypothetical protein [Trichomonas vaginalis G3]
MLFTVLYLSYIQTKPRYLTLQHRKNGPTVENFWDFNSSTEEEKKFLLNVTSSVDSFKDKLYILERLNTTTAKFIVAEYYTFEVHHEAAGDLPFKLMQECYQEGLDLCGDFLAYFYEIGLFTEKDPLKAAFIRAESDTILYSIIRTADAPDYSLYENLIKITEYFPPTKATHKNLTDLFILPQDGYRYQKYLKSNTIPKNILEIIKGIHDKTQKPSEELYKICATDSEGRYHFVKEVLSIDEDLALKLIKENQIKELYADAFLASNQDSPYLKALSKEISRNIKDNIDLIPNLAFYLYSNNYNNAGKYLLLYTKSKFCPKGLNRYYKDFQKYLGFPSKDEDLFALKNNLHHYDLLTRNTARIKLAFQIEDVYQIEHLLSESEDSFKISIFIRFVRYTQLMVKAYLKGGIPAFLDFYNIHFVKLMIERLVASLIVGIMSLSLFILIRKRVMMSVFD